jgi:hypothetical protein
MTNARRFGLWRGVILGSIALGLAGGLPAVAQEGVEASTEMPEPVAVKDVVYARQFTLEEPYTYTYRKEKPEIREGTILVLEVDRDLARPRQVGVRVLYVDDTPAERTNVGYLSGRMIVFVPGKVDLEKALVYFGSETLPERVDERHGRRELAWAKRHGIRPFDRKRVRTALEEGGDTLEAADSMALYRAVADLIDRYSPSEHDRAEGYRVKKE